MDDLIVRDAPAIKIIKHGEMGATRRESMMNLMEVGTELIST